MHSFGLAQLLVLDGQIARASLPRLRFGLQFPDVLALRSEKQIAGCSQFIRQLRIGKAFFGHVPSGFLLELNTKASIEDYPRRENLVSAFHGASAFSVAHPLNCSD